MASDSFATRFAEEPELPHATLSLPRFCARLLHTGEPHTRSACRRPRPESQGAHGKAHSPSLPLRHHESHHQLTSACLSRGPAQAAALRPLLQKLTARQVKWFVGIIMKGTLEASHAHLAAFPFLRRAKPDGKQAQNATASHTKNRPEDWPQGEIRSQKLPPGRRGTQNSAYGPPCNPQTRVLSAHFAAVGPFAAHREIRGSDLSHRASRRPSPCRCRQDLFNVCCDLHKVCTKLAKLYPNEKFKRQRMKVSAPKRRASERTSPRLLLCGGRWGSSRTQLGSG